MADSYVWWFVLHNNEHQILMLIQATTERRAWQLLAGSRKQSISVVRKTFTLDGFTRIDGQDRILGECEGDQYGLAVEPN